MKIERLTFNYPKRKAPVLDDLSLSLQEGKVYGLLGLNGEGKSTLLYLMSGLLTPTEGCVKIDGTNVRLRRPGTLSSLFIVPEEFSMPGIPMKKYVDLNAPFYPGFNRDDLNRYLDTFGMTEEVRLGEVSMGQKKKALISFALAAHTSWLFMDEPTNGLDIPGKSQFRKLLIREADERRGIIISTHQAQDIEQIIDHVLILHKGRMLLDAPVGDICDRLLFTSSATKEETAGAYCATPSFQGYSAMLPNPEQRDSELNLELLLTGALAHPEKIHALFTGKTM